MQIHCTNYYKVATGAGGLGSPEGAPPALGVSTDVVSIVIRLQLHIDLPLLTQVDFVSCIGALSFVVDFLLCADFLDEESFCFLVIFLEVALIQLSY
ncbi:hypothetical protein Pelo_4965 [Pelomyxa schiedti]|nr:hypothetical protein Pelo_4965 [Pelomyxa schiedti]